MTCIHCGAPLAYMIEIRCEECCKAHKRAHDPAVQILTEAIVKIRDVGEAARERHMRRILSAVSS